MKAPRNLEKALDAIQTRLGPVAGPGGLARSLSLERAALGIPGSVSSAEVLRRLVHNGNLKQFDLESKKYGAMSRIGTQEADVFDVALSLKPSGYFCHGTAVFLLGLSNEVPTTLYVNREQSPKRTPQGELTQAGLDRAFSNKGRRSAYTFQIYPTEEFDLEIGPDVTAKSRRKIESQLMGEVTLLSGKHTDALEVGTAPSPRGRTIPVTKLERTLIDIAVRPDYAGGPARVAAAYERAVSLSFSSNVLLATLRKLDYKYPYHQALGYYLERAGAEGSILDRLRALGMRLNFYLNYGMKQKKLNQAWQIYVPEGM